jgi:DNA replication protein DnaC
MVSDIHKLLEELKLRDARAALDDLLKLAQKNKLSYSAFLLELLRREHEGQRNRATASRLRRSGLREFWTLETFPFHIQKCVNKRLIYELAELDFIARGESLVFIGQAAVGKSGLASAILLKALYAGRRCLAISARELFAAMKDSHYDQTSRRFFQRLSHLDALLIEELGYLDVPASQQVNDFFHLMDDRCNRKSTIITTNLGWDEWAKFIGSGPLAAALISRLLQKCKVITFPKDAVNLRKPEYGLPATAPKPPILDAA